MANSKKLALVVTDRLFTNELASIAVAPLIEAGWQLDWAIWAHDSMDAQRAAVRRVEDSGADSDPGPAEMAGEHHYEVVVAQFAPIPTAAIRRGNGLRLIAVNRSGLQNIAVKAAEQENVEVFSVPGRNANAVAEHTVALILAQLRYVAIAHAALKGGSWVEEFEGPEPRELAEVTVGIIGYGQVGRRVHELLRRFDSQILVHDPYVDGDSGPAETVSLNQLMASSDVVSIHAPLTPATRNMIGPDQLRIMKPNSILVNTARAGLVNQDALRTALTAGAIGGAALDVFESEPLDPQDPLVLSARTTLTPHLAGTTRGAFTSGPERIADRLATYVADPRPR